MSAAICATGVRSFRMFGHSFSCQQGIQRIANQFHQQETEHASHAEMLCHRWFHESSVDRFVCQAFTLLWLFL
jgi:hypothetical protein